MITSTNSKRIALALMLMMGLFYLVSGAAAQMDPKAYDIASNYTADYGANSWPTDSNKGYGFGAWTLTINAGGGTAAVDRNDPAARSLVGMLNPSFRMWAFGNTAAYVNADRSFSAPMAIGDTFSFKWAFNWDTGIATGNKGFNIYVGDTQVVNVNNGFSSDITVNGVNTGFGYGVNAMTWTFTYVDATTLAVTANDRDGSGTYSVNVTITGAPTRFRFYVSGQATSNMRYPYFNELKIQPTVKYTQTGVAGNLGSATVTFPSTTSVTASGGQGTGAYEFRQNGGSGTVGFSGSGATRTITPTQAGTADIEVRKLGDNNYNASDWVAAGTLTINKGTPSVSTWPTATPITLGETLADSPLVGGLASPSGGTFAWTDDSIEPAEAGTFPYNVTYTPAAGDQANYDPISADVDLTVNSADKEDPEITAWPTASAITYGQSLASSTLSGGEASVDGTFVWTHDSTMPPVGAPAQSVTFYPDDDENYNTVIGAVAITVNKADPAVTTWPTAGAITYGQTLGSSTLTGGEATPAGAFAWTDSGIAPDIGDSDQEVTYTPTDTANYNAVAAAVSVTVNKATPTITTPPTASRIFVGDRLADSTLSGGAASVDGAFAWTDDTIEPARGTANQSVTFTPTDATRYNAVALNVSVAVWQDSLTFYVKPATWWNYNPGNPQMWGPFVGGTWSGHAMTFDAGLGWWKVTLEVDDAAAAITHQLRITQSGTTRYQKASGDFAANPVFTTTTGAIWIDASADAYAWSGSDFYLAAGATTETKPKVNQAITFDAGVWQSQTYGDAAFDLVASASSTLPVSFASLNTDVATIDGATVTIVGAGEATIRATQAGNDDYNAATPVDQVLTVAKAAATVMLADLLQTYDGSPKPATATTDPEGLTVTFTYDGSETAPTDADSYAVVGTVVDDNYQGSDSDTLVIAKATPVVTTPPAASSISLGQTLADSILTGGLVAPSGGEWAWQDDTIEPDEIGTFDYTAIYTPALADQGNYETGEALASVTVGAPKETPVVTWPTATPITYGQTVGDSTLVGGSAVNALDEDVPGTFSWVNPAVQPTAGTANRSVLFTPTDTASYNTEVGPVSLTVDKADPVVTTWPAAGALTYGQTLASSTLTGGEASVPGTFAWTDTAIAPDVGDSDQEVTFSPTDTANYNAVADDVTVTVGKATPTITTPPTASRIFVGDSLADSTLLGGAASVEGAFAWTDDTIEPARGTANQSVTFTPTDATRYNAVALDVSVAVWQDSLTFYVKPATWWNNNPHNPEMWGPFVGGTWAGHAMTLDSGLGWWKVTVEVDDAAAAITHQLRIGQSTTTRYQKSSDNILNDPVFTTTTGEIWIDASADVYAQWVGNDFRLAPGTTTETKPKADQTITFDAGEWQSKTFGDTAFDLVASASSGLPVSFGSLNADVATIEGVTVTIVGAGEATIRASQAGNADYNAAVPVDRVLTVAKATAMVMIGDLLQTYDGMPKPVSVTTDPEGLAFEVTYDGEETAPTDAGKYEVVVTVQDDDNQGTATDTLEIAKATPAVATPPTATSITLGQTLASSILSGGSVTPTGGEWAWQDHSIEPEETGTFDYTAIYTPAPADQDNYDSVSVLVSVTVDDVVKEEPLVTWPTATPIVYGQTVGDSALVGGSAVNALDEDVPGTFSWVNPDVQPTAGTADRSVLFTPTDTVNYETVGGPVSLSVSKADPVVTAWPTAGAITYGQTLASSTLTGGEATPAGTFAWTDDSIAPDVGDSDQEVTYTPTDTANYNAVAADVTVTASKATPTILTSPTASQIFVGDSLADSMLSGGAASVPGTFAWTDDTLEPARGTASQSVTFTPDDGARYEEVNFGVSVPVWYDSLTFYAKTPDWLDNDPGTPQMWGPFVAADGWQAHLMTYDSDLGWWKVTVEVDDAAALITYQWRIYHEGFEKYQKEPEKPEGNPTFTTTTGEIWVDGSGTYIWPPPPAYEHDFYLEAGTTTETMPKERQTITFAEGAWQFQTYGDAAFELEAGASSGLAVSFESLNTDVATIDGVEVTIVGAGEATIRASQAGNDDYAPAVPVDRVLTVGAKPVTVTPDADQSKVYGEADPVFAYGLDPVVSVTGALGREAGEDAGLYGYTLGDLTAGGNYELSLAGAAQFEITKAPVTVTPDGTQSKTYGEPDPTYTYGLDPAVSVTGALGREAGEDVGDYAYTLGDLDAGPNYELFMVALPDTFVIFKAPVAVTPDADQGKVYGDADPAFTYGLDPAVSVTGALGREAGEAVGLYGYTLGDLSAGGNYELYLAGLAQFEIEKATAMVELHNLTGHAYDGTPKAALATTDPEGLAVELTYDGSATEPVQAGSYAVIATVNDASYVGSAAGTLVIDKADQAINFPAISDQYTTDVVPLSATASSGLAVSYEVSGPASLDGTTLTFTGAGEVSVTAKQGGNGNYNAADDVVRTFDVTLPPSGLQISQAAVNVREAGEGRFFVRLDNPPLANVAVSVSHFSGDASLTVKSGASLTFKPSNWNLWQAVTLGQAADDGNADNETATFLVATAGAEGQYVTATALDDDIGENVALAASRSTISVVNGGRPADLIDGIHLSSVNYGTIRFPPPTTGTLTLDLKAATALSQVRVLNWNWDVRYHQYQIEWSLDGASWTLLADATEGEHRGWEDWAATGVTARYLKITGKFNSANPTLCIAEWEVYGTRTLPDLPQVQLLASTVNVREGGEGRAYVRLDRAPVDNLTVTISRVDGDADLAVQGSTALSFTPGNWAIWQRVTLGAAQDDDALNDAATFLLAGTFAVSAPLNAVALDDDIGANVALASAGTTIRVINGGRPADLIDGIHNVSLNYGTIRFPPEPVGNLTLDLKAATALSQVRVLNWDWDTRYHQYKIEWSLDGTSWTMLADATDGEHRGWEDWAATGVTARYLKLTAKFNSANPTLCIAEWEVYAAAEPGRRSLALAKAVSGGTESEPIAVLTSDGLEDLTGWNAVDGDSSTAWVGQKAGGGYLVIEYRPALELSALEVELAEGSLAGMEALYSQDGVEWQPLTDQPASLNFLWLVFPDDGTDAVPGVLEILPNP